MNSYLRLAFVCISILTMNIANAGEPPVNPPPPPQVTLDPPAYLQTKEWRFTVHTSDGISSIHFAILGADLAKGFGVGPDDFKDGFSFTPKQGDLLDPGSMFSFQTLGQTPETANKQGEFMFRLQSPGFTGKEQITVTYDYVWDYPKDPDDPNSPRVSMRTVFLIDDNNKPQILTTSAVPEPSDWAMILVGFSVVATMRRRRVLANKRLL